MLYSIDRLRDDYAETEGLAARHGLRDRFREKLDAIREKLDLLEQPAGIGAERPHSAVLNHQLQILRTRIIEAVRLKVMAKALKKPSAN